MKNTRFMEVMFSNTDEELAKQVDSDIKKAQEDGVVDTEEVKYEKTENGDVAITDKENGEVTLAQKNPDEADTYDLIAVPDGQLEKFVHPSADGVTPGNQVGAPDEKVDSHMDGSSVISPNLADGGNNPEAGHEKKVEDTANEGPQGEGACPKCGQNPCACEKDEEKNFSVTSDNTAWQKVFSMPQEFADYLFSEVIETSETSVIGDLKIDRCPEDENSVIVTSESTGDQVKVTLTKDEMNVTELRTNSEEKKFSEDEQFMPLYLIGVQPYDHIIVDAQAYGQERAEALKAQLEEDGIESVQIFENQGEAREYAIGLLEGLGANIAAGDVPEEPTLQREYSEAVESLVWTLPYNTSDTVLMSRMFSEDACGIAGTRDAVEEAIKSGKETEFDGMTITPIDAQVAVVMDGGEATKATLDGADMKLEAIDPEEVAAITGNESVIEAESGENDQAGIGAAGKEDAEAEVKDFSEYDWTNEAETRFFSEGEEMTDYMIRLFSEEADQDKIEAAIASGNPAETENEVITPIDSKTAVVEDKGNGEFTKVTLISDEAMNVHPLGEADAANLLGSGKTGDIKAAENEKAAEEGEVKNYSEIYDWTNEDETRFFSEGEEMTNYMVRLFSEESDQNVIEDAIAKGDQIENDTEIVTPVNSTTAVVEDKENGEFTKAIIKNDDEIEVNKISEEEAKELTDNIKVEDKKEDAEDSKAEDKKTEDEKEFSESLIGKFFAAAGVAPAAVTQAPVDPAVAAVQAGQAQAQQAAPVAEEVVAAPAPTVEDIEDKALAAIQSIKAAVEEGAAQIMEAKAAPAPTTAEPEIQEAQFSAPEEKTFSQNSQNDTLISWLSFK